MPHKLLYITHIRLLVEQVCGEIDLIAKTSPEYEMRVYELSVLPFSLRIDDVLSESEMERLNGYMLRMLGYDFTNEQVYASMCMLRPSELSALFTKSPPNVINLVPVFFIMLLIRERE